MNAYYGFNIAATQNFINDIIEPTLSATVAFNSPTSKNITIVGGNPSAGKRRIERFHDQLDLFHHCNDWGKLLQLLLLQLYWCNHLA